MIKKRYLFYLIVALITLLICFWKPFLRLFKEKENFNYQNVRYINILFDMEGHSDDMIRIENKEDIEKIINYLNSIEIIKEKRPEKLYNNESNPEYFIIYIYGEQSDAISFSTKYLSLHPDGACDCVYTEYYIVNAGYNPKDGSSKISRFLDKLIESM